MDATRITANTTSAFSAPTRSAGQDEDPHKAVKEKFEWSGRPAAGEAGAFQPQARTAAPVQTETAIAMKAPPGARKGEDLGVVTVLDAASVAPGADLIKAEEGNTSEAQTRNWADIGKKVGLVVLGGLAVGVPLAMPTIAQAAPAQVATQQQVNRDVAPVHVGSLQDVVNQYNGERPFFVVGTPRINGTALSQNEMREFQQVLREHPNTVVVLVENTNNEDADNTLIGRGIGNNPAFQNIKNAQTGEGEGVMLVIYFANRGDASDRPIFYRAGELPDRLGVGEDNWAAPDHSPRQLMRTFINAFRNEGRSLAGSVDAVFDQVNGTIAREVQAQVGNAQQNVSAAQSALNGVKPKVAQFQQRHGSGGTIGSPDVNSWQQQLTTAQQQLANRDFAGASRTANALVQTIRGHETLMANYEAAPGVASQVETQIQQLQQQIQNLPDNSQAQSARSSFERAQSELQQFRNDHSAKSPSFQQHLDAAKSAAAEGLSQAQSSKDTAARNEAIRNYGAAAGAVAILATGIILNVRARGARKAAEAEYEEAINEIGKKSHELLELMNDADYHKVANYEGKTREKADALMANVVDALTLVGGAEKFANEAKSLIDAGGFGRVKNWFTTGNFKKAERLLTDPNEKLTFSFTDSSRKVIEKDSQAATWREELLKRGTSREFTQSLQEILLAMAENRDEAKGQLEELDKKGSEINTFIQTVDDASAAALKKATSLKAGESFAAPEAKVAVQAAARSAVAEVAQDSGEKYPNLSADQLLKRAAFPAAAGDASFTAPAVVDNLLPMVRGSKAEGGLLAKGRELADRNFITAWDDYTKPAERMTQEATQIIDLGVDTRTGLLQTLGAADSFLHANQVKTDWAHGAKDKLSTRLNEAANKAMRTSAADDIKQIGSEIQALEARVERVVEQDYERREISPKLIADAEADVVKTRQELCDQLQKFGVFKSGKPEEVLVEPQRNPTDRTKASHDNLAKVKPQLDTGNMEKAGEHLGNIRDLTDEAHDLVAQSRAAVNSYHGTLDERQKRTAKTTDSIASTYQPSFDRIKSTYAAACQQLIAAEVGAGDTIGDNIAQARADIKKAEGETADGIKNFDRAYVLTSRDDLSKADATLKSAQAHLDGITNAEKLLGQKQTAVEGELKTLEGNYARTRANAGQVFVRSQAKSLLSQGEQSLRQATGAVNAKPKNPFEAKNTLGASESMRGQVESAIAADKQAYDRANSAVASAEREMSSAKGQIMEYAVESWTFSNRCGSARNSVGHAAVAGALASLGSAEGDLRSARTLISAQRYEEAAQEAQQAERAAGSAVGLAAAARASAYASHMSEVRRLEAEEDALERREAEERRRQEEAEAARRRASESSSSSGGSSGGWGGGGGGSGGSSGRW